VRSIGQITGPERARALSNYLAFEGIENQVEPDDSGHFIVWINEEEQIEAARDILATFLQNPENPRFQVRPAKKTKVRPLRVFDRTNIHRASYSFGMGPLTIVLILICAGLYVMCNVLGRVDVENFLMMTSPAYAYYGPGQISELYEITHGQIWRLVTPAFLHGGPLHIIMNMMMLQSLGSLIEARLNSRDLLILVLGIAVASDLTQFFWAGPRFVGMSGVLYGLFGYIWIRGKYDTRSGLFVDPSSVRWMLGWLVLCFFLFNIANGAHVGGLVAGAIWGFIDAKRLG
jgi:GlpG protein